MRMQPSSLGPPTASQKADGTDQGQRRAAPHPHFVPFFNPVGTVMSFHLGMQVRDHSSRGWRRNRDAQAVKNDGGNDERECGWGKEEPLV